MATDKRPSLDEIFGTTTSAEKPINTVAERPSLDEIFGPSDEKKEQPQTDEWGDPITPISSHDTPNAKSEQEVRTPISPEHLQAMRGVRRQPGEIALPEESRERVEAQQRDKALFDRLQSKSEGMTLPKGTEKVSHIREQIDFEKARENRAERLPFIPDIKDAALPEEERTLLQEVDSIVVNGYGDYGKYDFNVDVDMPSSALDYDGAAGAGAATYLKALFDRDVSDRKHKGADAVIQGVYKSIPVESVNKAIETKVQNNKEYQSKKLQFESAVNELIPDSGDKLSAEEIESLFASLTPEERAQAEKEIAEKAQAIENLQSQYVADVEAIYKAEAKNVESQISNRIIENLVKLDVPKDDLEYIGSAIYNNSLVGLLWEMSVNAAADGSGTDFVVSQQALAKANASPGARIVGGAGAILADTAVFSILGAAGSGAAAAVRTAATEVVAGQIARRAAVSATNSAVRATAKRIVQQNAMQKFASSAIAQSITLGGYNGLLTAAQEHLSPTGENGSFNWRNLLWRMGEGAVTGVVLGGVGTGTEVVKGKMYRARPDMAYTFAGQAADLGVGLAGFTAENAAFLGVGSLFSGEEITAEAIGESFATLGLLKGIGVLKRVAKGEKLMRQPDFVERTISDLKFTKEEMDAMRKAGVDMEQIDIVSEAVREVLNTPNKSQIAQETISSRPLMEVYNSVMSSREVPISAKMKLQYIVKGTVPRGIGATSLTISDTNGTPTVKAYDINGRLVQIREFANKAEAESFMKKTQPLLERNTIIEGEKVLRGGQIAVTMQQAIEQYAKENPNTDARTLFTELMIDLGYVKGEVPASSRERVDAIKSRIKEQFVDPASQLVDGIARKYGTTVESVYRALNIKPDLRTVRESQLVKAYVDGLKQFSESMSGPIEAEQARYAEQVRPQIEQGKREVEDVERETAFVRESLNEAAKRMATEDGKQIAIVRLATGEQVAVYKGRIVTKENGTIDTEASENTVVIKRIDAEGNEVRNQVGIGEIAEVVEFSTPGAAVEESMSVVEAQAAKKLSLDNAITERGEQGVEVVTIDGNSGKIVGIDENGAYILRAKGESGKEVDVPVSINDIAEINTEQPVPATTEQMTVADATEKVVEAGLATDVEVEYDDDFPPLTEADMAPQLDADKIQWEKLSPEDYTSASAMLYGDATTLADSHIYHTNSRAKLAKAKQSVAEQQKVIDKLNSRFATLSSPAEAQKLRKQIATAEQEKAKREQAVKNIEQQMAKYAHAMRKYGVEVATENDLLAERAKLEEERNALLEADKELDRYEQEEATKGKKTIANTEANRKYIEQLYADRFGVSPAQAGPRQAILWDLANGAIKLRWDNVTTDSGAVQKGLAAELGLSASEKRIYKAVTDNKNGQSVDAYAHDLWQGAEWGQEVDDMTLKDMILDVLQSTPNGSIALKELADMSGVQADLEAQISLGKGDIQRKLEEVDANLAKNAQQMADFRKRINNTVQKLESGEPLILPVGEGEFGPIYDQFKGKPQEAVDFLLAEKNGEAIGALSHKDIGEIDLVWGKEGTGHSDGYGLSKLAKYHPEVLDKLQPILDNMEVVSRNANRVNLESPKYQAAVRLTWNNERKNWLLTAFEKRNSAIDNTTDTGETAISGKQNDTATLQSTASESKDTTTIPKNQISQEEFFGNAPISEDIPFMIEQETADKGVVSEAEQNFEREVFDAFAGHLGETLGAESVVTDAAEARRVLEWHQAVGERLRTAVRENAEITAERAEIERVAKENGTWLKAPNGKDTNLTERQWIDVRTSRFKSWFGDWENDPENASKVVDENGEPLVMYHGSNWKPNNAPKNEGVFKMREGALGKGAYFTSVFAEAADYARAKIGRTELTEDEIEEGKYVTEAFLNIRDIENIWPSKYGQAGLNAVATEPNQIKSATENTGEYSPANDDIRMSIEAYHGSGADFEKFDHSFMGTGEGAQAFGWGTYVTEVENIARGYAKASGEVKERKERKLAKQSLLLTRDNIAKQRMFVERKQKELVQMEEHYAKLEDDLKTTVFPHNRKRLKETIQELANDIRNAKGEIESSLFQIEQLKPQEEQFAKVWEQFDAQRKIAEKEQHIEWNRLELVTLNRKLEKFENALDSLKHSGKMGDELVEDLIAMTNLRYELEGKDEMGAQEALIAEINRVKKIIEGTERGISIRQKEIEELQAIEQPKFRNLYSVEVPDNTGENYLPWDKDLTPEMKDKVYPQVEKAFATYLEDARNRPDAESIKSFIAGIENIFEKYVQGEERSGEQIYRDLRLVLRSDKAASGLLHSIGFTGIEYPAQYTTGGRADGAKNYVIFNADDVKIVDHVQYFKTPNGEVYGFVYEDKIYLDPTNIDPKAPVHEYTELWCREVAKANKPLWERGKELVKQTKVWEAVNADENYKHQSEDLRASEAWSRIIADEMTGKAREVGSKGLMAKLRAWMRSFWKAVKSVVEKWTNKELNDLTVEKFKQMTMADFINKVDPRKWNAKKPKEVSKSLVGIHNISLDKLQKALKQGGLANPSAAVIDIAKGDHFDYGEYSFIMPKSLVDKKSGRNIGTFDRDAWTPLYPSVEYSHSKESRKNLNKLVEGLDEGLADKIKRETLAKVNGNGFYSGLQIVFLKERGVEVPIASKAGKFFGTIEEFKQLFGGKEPTYENYQALDKAQKDEVTLWIRAKGMPEEIARYKELLVKPARKEGLWNFLLDDVGYGKFDQAVNGLQADARNVGTPDYEKTIDNAVNYIRENGLQEEFDAWQSETFNNLGFDERIQVGWSPSGDRIMRKNTLENVSKYMRRQGKNASADHWSNSEGKMLAQLVQNFSSLDKIRANKGRLRSAADDVVGIRKRINEMAQVFMNFAKHTDLFMEEQSALAYLEDILVGGMDPDKVVAEFNAATKRNVTLTEEQKAEMKQLREDMKSLPVQYFETKFERPVMFNEFAAVVAPDTMPESVEQQLRDAGLAIYKYNPDVEGDRRKATLAATASEDIRFMIVGEKGAAALDQAEEATTRLDNLAVAREMEASNRDALAIRFATGWERGADGKWRYEIGDAKIKDTKDVGGAVVVRYEDDMLWNSGKLGDIVDAPELFEAYPQLRDVRLDTDALPTEPNNGTYYPSTMSIKINADNIATLNSILNHEIQHAIQHIEGFASGSNLSVAKKEVEELSNKAAIWRFRNDIAAYMREHPDTYPSQVQKKVMELYAMTDGLIEEGESLSKEDIEELEARGFFPFEDGRIKAFNLWARGYDGEGYEYAYNLWRERKIPTAYERYKRTIGETEARNVQKRMRMSPEERRATLLSETEDVAREDQIFLNNGLHGNPTISRMIIGEKGAAELDRVEEATARLDNLAVAREMEISNRDAKAIKLATGWERGADGKWRYEIPDFKLKSDTALVKNVDNQIVTTLGEVIDDETLFTAFPELRKLSVVSLPNQKYGGHYQDGSIMPHIALGNKLFTPSTKRLVELEKEFDKDMTSEQEDALMSEFNAEVERAVAQPEFYTLVTSAAKKVLVHEVQHAIQRIEGFARGGSWELERPDNDAEMLRLRDAVRGARAYIDHFKGDNIAMAIRDGKKYNYLEWRSISPESQQILLEYLGRKRKVNYADFRAYLDNAHKMTLPKQYGMSGYRKFAGEVESRNAEARMYMTPEERRATLLSETEDVAREDQIFLENNLGGANMLSDDSLAKRVKEILDDYDNDGKLYSSPLDIANGVEAIINDYSGKESTTSLENILADFRAAQSESRSYGDRMDAGGEDIFENELRRYVSNAERTTFSASFSESVEAPTRKPRKSAAEKSLEKIESLREQLKNKKRSLNDTLLDVYNFLTSKDIAETMGEGVGKAQYRRVIKNSIEAIRKAYDVTDAEEKRKTIFKYLGEIDDSLSQLLTRQRLNEVTDILDKAIYGYTAQGVRTGKRIDEHTREIFDILRNAIGEPVEEERDDSGRRKPVHYRLKNRTEAGDITSSFRLRSVGNNEGIIAKLRSEADDIIASADELDTATTRAAAQLEYASNLLSLYDNALQLNEAIGQTTDDIADIQREIDRTNEQYKAAATGSEEKRNLYKMRQKLQNDLEAEQMNRAALRHRYASILKTFTTSLEELDKKGAGDFARAELEKAEQAVKWRRGIYNSIKNPNAPVLPVEDYNRQGKEVKVNWKGLNTRAKINESAFMATFAEMSRDIDINSIPGQWLPDGWYYQFMLAPGGYMERTDWRYKTEKALREELDAEVLKLSGDKKADEPYKLFAQLAQEPSGLVIPRLSVSKNKDGKTVGGYQDNIPLTIGQILYMRNAIRQPNGYAGYLAWGIPEEDMKKIAQYAETKYPKYCRFFDWVVLEFMPKLYEMQDAIYFEKFGTHLPKTAFYFPFVRDKRMVGKVAEVGEGEVSLPSSVTGNIVERVKTSAKMDLQADAFSVLQDHIKETLDWCAYVELTDKFNSVGTSHAFGNMLKAQGVSVQKLKEMYEVAVGQGKINSTDNTTLTKTLNAISKGLVAGNIVLNPNAAIKQIVSATATLGYSANPKLLAIWAKNFFVPSVIKTGIGKVVEKMKSGDIDPVEAIDWKVVGDNWKWAIENIPTLRERWEGREAGFEVLKSHSFDSWDKLTAMITNVGLAPNAFVDMLTCSNAAKTVYEYEYPRLLERGRSKVEAHREACVKAAIFVNETQQSSLNGFLSSFQSGGGLQRILGVGLGAYQNSSMAFARNERFTLTNMLRMANSATRNDMQLRQVAAYKELGVEDAKAVELAKQDIKESYGQQVAGFVHNGVLNNYIWKIAGVLLGGLASAGFAAMFDKEEWNKLWKNEQFRQELASAVSAETLLWQTPLFYNAPITKQILEYSHNVAEGKAYGGIFESPTSQSAQDLIDAIFKQWVGVKNEITGERETKEPTRYDRSAEWLVASTLIKAGLGVNPDLVVRMAQGIDDMMKDGVQVEDVMATLASPRGLTRAITGEPRPGESKEEYLDRMSYIYRQVNAGSGEYSKKFVSERTKEYIDNKDNELYRQLGIVPREVRILEQKVKAIRKQLLFFDKSDEGIAEFKALSETERKQQIEIAKGYDKVFALTRKMNQGILPFDEDGMSKRREELQQRYEMLKQVYDMWIEYNNK